MITEAHEIGMSSNMLGRLGEQCEPASCEMIQLTGPRCAAEVTIDASGLMEGDIAGLCAFQGCYAYAAITRRQGSWHAIMAERNALHPDNTAERHYDEIPVEVESLPLPSPQVTCQ